MRRQHCQTIEPTGAQPLAGGAVQSTITAVLSVSTAALLKEVTALFIEGRPVGWKCGTLNMADFQGLLHVISSLPAGNAKVWESGIFRRPRATFMKNEPSRYGRRSPAMDARGSFTGGSRPPAHPPGSRIAFVCYPLVAPTASSTICPYWVSVHALVRAALCSSSDMTRSFLQQRVCVSGEITLRLPEPPLWSQRFSRRHVSLARPRLETPSILNETHDA